MTPFACFSVSSILANIVAIVRQPDACIDGTSKCSLIDVKIQSNPPLANIITFEDGWFE